MTEKRPVRKSPRLSGADYPAPKSYFVTFCTNGMVCVLSKVGAGSARPSEQQAEATITLSEIGAICRDYIIKIPERFKTVRVDSSVIMPNHIHMILTLSDASCRPEYNGRADPAPTLSSVLGWYKYQTTILNSIAKCAYKAHGSIAFCEREL